MGRKEKKMQKMEEYFKKILSIKKNKLNQKINLKI